MHVREVEEWREGGRGRSPASSWMYARRKGGKQQSPSLLVEEMRVRGKKGGGATVLKNSPLRRNDTPRSHAN